MADEKFDSIVVGAGPAGISAAITMAKAGLNVAVLERGEYAGAKNVQGAVLYSKMLQDVIPDFWKDCPLERAIVEERVFDNGAFQRTILPEIGDDILQHLGIKNGALYILGARVFAALQDRDVQSGLGHGDGR